MSTTTRSKGGGKQAAARSERKPKPKVVDWKGIKLETPSSLPPTLMLDLGRIEALAARGEQPFGPTYELIESLVGAEGMGAIRTHLANGTDYEAFDAAVFTDILNAVLAAHGVSAGESSASNES